MVFAPASGHAQRAHVLTLAGAKPLEWAVELGRRVAEQITRGIPAYARNDAGFEQLRTGTESTTLQLLTVLAGDDVGSAATSESFAAVTDAVQRRISLDELLRGIQLGHGVMAGEFLSACSRLSDPDTTLAQMRALSERMFHFFDTFIAEMSTYYMAERQRWDGSDSMAKIALVSNLLDGDAADARVEQKLGYALAGSHVAVIARGPQSETAAIEAAVSEILTSAHCAQRLILSATPGVIWAWGAVSEPDVVSDALGEASLPEQVHAVAGAVAPGLAGFRSSHNEAAASIALTGRMPSRRDVVPYAEVDLLSLLLEDSDRAHAFAARELGRLGVQSPQARELRRTLAAFIDERGSPHAAAQRIDVSRNTVSYRVQRAEEMLGRSVNVRRLQLRSALLIQEIADSAAKDEQRTNPPR